MEENSRKMKNYGIEKANSGELIYAAGQEKQLFRILLKFEKIELITDVVAFIFKEKTKWLKNKLAKKKKKMKRKKKLKKKPVTDDDDKEETTIEEPDEVETEEPEIITTEEPEEEVIEEPEVTTTEIETVTTTYSSKRRMKQVLKSKKKKIYKSKETRTGNPETWLPERQSYNDTTVVISYVPSTTTVLTTIPRYKTRFLTDDEKCRTTKNYTNYDIFQEYSTTTTTSTSKQSLTFIFTTTTTTTATSIKTRRKIDHQTFTDTLTETRTNLKYLNDQNIVTETEVEFYTVTYTVAKKTKAQYYYVTTYDTIENFETVGTTKYCMTTSTLTSNGPTKLVVKMTPAYKTKLLPTTEDVTFTRMLTETRTKKSISYTTRTLTWVRRVRVFTTVYITLPPQVMVQNTAAKNRITNRNDLNVRVFNIPVQPKNNKGVHNPQILVNN